MAFFRLEVYDTEGKVIEKVHINMGPTGSVQKALKHPRVIKIKRDAMNKGFAFRCKLEED